MQASPCLSVLWNDPTGLANNMALFSHGFDTVMWSLRPEAAILKWFTAKTKFDALVLEGSFFSQPTLAQSFVALLAEHSPAIIVITYALSAALPSKVKAVPVGQAEDAVQLLVAMKQMVDDKRQATIPATSGVVELMPSDSVVARAPVKPSNSPSLQQSETVQPSMVPAQPLELIDMPSDACFTPAMPIRAVDTASPASSKSSVLPTLMIVFGCDLQHLACQIF